MPRASNKTVQKIRCPFGILVICSNENFLFCKYTLFVVVLVSAQAVLYAEERTHPFNKCMFSEQLAKVAGFLLELLVSFISVVPRRNLQRFNLLFNTQTKNFQEKCSFYGTSGCSLVTTVSSRGS